MGHEGAGTILEVGPDVRSVRPGDSVLITWIPRRARRLGAPLGPNAVARADGSSAGFRTVFTWADHALVDDEFVVKVPADTAMDVSAIIGCAVITGAGAVCRTADVQAGQSVAIFGVGGVGLSALAAARVRSASPIIAIDVRADKLALARSAGATHLVDASGTDPVPAIRKITPTTEVPTARGEDGSGVDWAFDCIGVPQTIQQIVSAVRPAALGNRPGGTAVLVGVPQSSVDLDVQDIMEHAKTLVGSLGGSGKSSDDIPMYVQWHKEGHLPLDAFVTERYRLDEINEAVTRLGDGQVAGRAILTLGSDR